MPASSSSATTSRALRGGSAPGSRGSGLWRYAPVLPIADPAHRADSARGYAPARLPAALPGRWGVRRLLLKFDGSNPTGTVKDRSSATAVAAALRFGYRATSVVSSGNAGSSIAAYSARAGLPSLIFAYERASAPKLLHMAATTANLIIYKGVYDDLITIWDRLVEEQSVLRLRGLAQRVQAGGQEDPRLRDRRSRRAGRRPTSSWPRWRWARPSSPRRAAFARCARRAGSSAYR